MDATNTQRIKPGYGYWDTTSYPIGGSFRRAGADGVPIVEVLRSFDTYKGCNREGLTSDGRKVAYDVVNTETLTQ